ncbi:MAG: hypothetical protein Q8N18_20655 [Opitutaceae bacterium]|nr:hypothetical protein [Opitutaceae bacterium]
MREKPAPTTPAKPRAPRKPRPSRFRDFDSARAFAHALKLESSTGWQAYIEGKHPEKEPLLGDIPRTPRNAYRDQWQGWGDWLGTGNVAPFRRIFRPFEEARAFARSLGFISPTQWQNWCRKSGQRPPDIPSDPPAKYRDQGWISWPDFLQPPA